MPGDIEQERSDAFWLSSMMQHPRVGHNSDDKSMVSMEFRTFVDLEGVYIITASHHRSKLM